jgi:CelD/BcsL family acetyltransferase involved in cellulose biosynthesis
VRRRSSFVGVDVPERMKVSLIPGHELSDDLARVWIGLQQTNPDLSSPYFHPEFTKVIAAVRHDVEVAALESDGKIVAFLPFQREQPAVGGPVGGIISDYHGLICAHDFRFVPSELLKQSRLIAWDFDHLPTSQLSFTPFHSTIDASPQIHLSRGYHAYVQQRRAAGSDQIKKIGNLIRRVEREIGPLRFVADSTDAASLESVLAWKSLQYRQSGKPDLFAPGWIREAVQRIFTTRTDGCSGILSLLYAGDRLVAGHFGIRSQQAWHYWFPSYDKEAAKYSPGLILLEKMAEHAPAIGVSIIDLGKGMSFYKERLMNSNSPLASGRLESPWSLFRRKTWRIMRSRLGDSPFGPPARAALEWLRPRSRVAHEETANSDEHFGGDLYGKRHDGRKIGWESNQISPLAWMG